MLCFALDDLTMASIPNEVAGLFAEDFITLQMR